MDEAGIIYMADVPEDTQVYLTTPEFGVPRLNRASVVGGQPARES